jgi:energy-coupling factor transporter ATP-binding protein EcfA2
MKITRIILQSFRAFDESFELDLDGGKNLLLHGENGSGKSSIYLALKRFFEERGDDIAKHRNHFSPGARTSHVHVHIKGKDAAGADHDHEFNWDVPDGHPLPVPKDPATAPISKELRSMLVDGAHRAGFLDYRMMLRTHLLSNPLPRSNRGPKVHDIIYGAESEGLEAQLFDLASLVILAGVRVETAGGSQTTIGTLIRKVWENRPPARYKYQLTNANSHANGFNQAFNAKLLELEAKLAAFLNYFENHQLAIKFQPVSLTWDKSSLELKGAELIPEITFRGQPVTDHHQFLNEARLSAIATCLFLAGVLLSDNDYSNPAYPRFLVLDDALIGLDLQNRMPVLRMLTGDAFKNYQIFLFTHDRVWFDLARGHLREQDGWLHKELLADETTGKLIPRCKPAQSDLDRAKTHLDYGELMAAAVHARAAFEWKLKNVCQDRGIEIKFKKDHKDIGADDLWQGIIARQRKREELQKGDPKMPDFVPLQLEKDVEAMRSTVLNQLSHAGAPGLVRDDVRDALKTIEALHNHNFSKVGSL